MKIKLCSWSLAAVVVAGIGGCVVDTGGGDGTEVGDGDVGTTELALSACTSVGLTMSLSSPRPITKQVKFTGTASGCAEPRYLFSYRPLGTDTWTTIQSGVSNRVTWAPEEPGEYEIRVRAKNKGESAWGPLKIKPYTWYEIPCGNGLVDPGTGEQCDDGNTLGGDGCDANCQIEYYCGDGVVLGGEQCDDGNTVSEDGCSATCQDELCGDGILQSSFDPPGPVPPEQCDDGNAMNGDGCSATCQLEAICGDGIVQAPEECDDGIFNGGPNCSRDCQLNGGG